MTLSSKTVLCLTTATFLGLSHAALADDDHDDSSNDPAPAEVVYSGSELANASVYAKDDEDENEALHGQKIGEVKDVLLDKKLRLQSFVIQTRDKGKFGALSTRAYSVSPEHLTITADDEGDSQKPEYRVELDMSPDKLSDQPVYNTSWLANAEDIGHDAWNDTKESANSAWNKIKGAADDIINGAGDD